MSIPEPAGSSERPLRLQQETEAKTALTDSEPQSGIEIPEAARARLQQLHTENQRLRALVEEFDATSQLVFRSFTWRAGRLISWPLRRLRILDTGSAQEHAHYLRGEYETLGSPTLGMSAPPLSGRWETVRRLLNRNSFALLRAAIRELPKTGVRGFINRTLAYVELNRPEETVAHHSGLKETLRLLRLVEDEAVAPEPHAPIDILVPIFNGLRYLRELLPRIIANTDLPYRLILIDDASPDAEAVAYLHDFAARHPEVLMVRNAVNLGFVATVNRGFELTRNDFVILNQDTQVPPGWLSRLMRPLLRDRGVASVTPYTNAGTICSFPDFLQDCPRFEGLSTEVIDQCFQRIDPDAVGEIEIPTGVGFCMAINKDAADAIGLFNADLFGRGYGEENDWCRRAVTAGYRNLMIPNLFVYHEHGGIFESEEKQRLLAANLETVNRLHPDYPQAVNRFIARDPLRPVRHLMLILAASRREQRIHLVIDHALGGGANAFAQQCMNDWIAKGDAVLSLAYHARQTRYGLSFRLRQWRVEFALGKATELVQLCESIRIDRIHLNSLVSHPDVLDMLEMIKRLKTITGAELIFYLHDYHAVSPVYTLLNHQGHYCGVPADLGECQTCLAHNQGEYRLYYPHPDALDMKRWRAAWRALLRETDSILCFSRASADILRRAYPESDIEHSIRVEPHSTPFLAAAPRGISQYGEATRPLTIGVLGAINVQKGVHILGKMAKRIQRERLDVRITVIGHVSEPLPERIVTVTGRYDRQGLPSLIQKQGVDIFFLPSIWPETYMLTADEALMLDRPLALFDLGAPAERFRSHEQVLIIDEIDADRALDAILDFMTHHKQPPQDL